MARYHAGFTTSAAAAGAAYVDLRTGASIRARILEIGIFSLAATANLWSLERSTTVGVATTTVAGQPGEPSDAAANLVLGTAWSTAPASTTGSMRRIQGPGQIGAGVIWSFGLMDMIIPVSAALAIFNRGAAAGAICSGYVTWDE